MANGLPEADWSHVLRRAFEVPDIVSDAYALEAIEHWVQAHLETSELTDADKAKLAKELPAAVVAFAVSGGLDYYLVRSLARIPTSAYDPSGRSHFAERLPSPNRLYN